MKGIFNLCSGLFGLAMASKERISLQIAGARNLQGCKWEEKLQMEFCCTLNSTTECDAEFEWWYDDNFEKQDAERRKRSAAEMNETAGKIMQWVTIGVCAVCCPILIIVAICMCIIKRKEAAYRAQAKTMAFEASDNFAESSGDNSQASSSNQRKKLRVATKNLGAAKGNLRTRVTPDQLESMSYNSSDASRPQSSCSASSSAGSYLSSIDSQNREAVDKGATASRNPTRNGVLMPIVNISSSQEKRQKDLSRNKGDALSSQNRQTQDTLAPASSTIRDTETSQYLPTNMSQMSQDHLMGQTTNMSNTVKQQAHNVLGRIKGKDLSRTQGRASYNSTPNALPRGSSAGGGANGLTSHDDGEVNRDGEDLSDLRDFLQREESDTDKRNNRLEIAKSTASPPNPNSKELLRTKNGRNNTIVNKRENALEQFSDDESDDIL